VTLEDIAGFIRDGREVQIIDLKSGDDLTRQYLLQIIAEHESRGENVLPVNILNDLVRSYSTQATSSVPQFLAASFDMFRDSQSKWVEQMSRSNPMAGLSGFEAVQAQQEAFLKAMIPPVGETSEPRQSTPRDGKEDLDDIRKQLSELQEKLSRMNK
jgi:polyhydroxyalkanoate synthesis repressor PhaR